MEGEQQMHGCKRLWAPVQKVLGVCILASFLLGIAGHLTFAIMPPESSVVPEMLKDIFPGASSSFTSPLNLPTPQAPVELNGVIYFIADDGVRGRELWRSDGTAVGTYIVKDIRPGSTGSHDRPQKIVISGGLLFFRANDGTHGLELWRSDGTETGTYMVKDVFPGGTEPLGSRPDEFTDVGGIIFFSAFTSLNGAELWRSDGTEAGTYMITDIAAGTTSSDPTQLLGVGDQCFFVAGNQFGRELWRSDGTAPGTFMVKDIYPFTSSSVVSPHSFVPVGGILFFLGNGGNGYRLWRSDGTTPGTFEISSVALPQGVDPFFSTMVDFNGILLFAATTPSSNPDTRGLELWRSDGTNAGTFLVKDIFPGPTSSNPQDLTVSGGKVYFRANDGVGGAELWRSDGTEAGTLLVKDILAAGSAQPDFLVDVGGILFFSASGAAGNELWRSNGTTEGTVQAADILPGVAGSSPQSIVGIGSKVLFTANDGVHGRELWGLNLNVAPDAVDDTAVTNEDTAVLINVLANDIDSNGDLISISGVIQGSNGQTSINADGTISYTPAPDFFGADNFTYTINDGNGGTDSATVYVNVIPINDPPISFDVAVTLNEDTQVQILLSAFDIDSSSLNFTVIGPPANGNFTLNGGTVVYIPDPNFNGVDTFTFAANDGGADSNIATVTINVDPVDDPPVLAMIGDQVVAEGASLAFELSASDVDGEQPLTFSSSVLPDGALLDPMTGAFSWEPEDGQAGIYTLTFTVTDPTGLATFETITITVLDVIYNSGPVCSLAYPSIAELWSPDHRMVPITIRGVTDPDNDPLTIIVRRILQDEPTNSNGDGNTSVDGTGVNTPQASVRAERSAQRRGAGNGRVYEIFFDASDGRGGSCTGSIKVGVPHDQRSGPAVDDGRRYDSTVAGGACLNCEL